MRILLGRTSPRCNIPEVEEQSLPCDVLRVCFYQEYHAYQEIQKYFLSYDYDYLVLASDDIVVKAEHIERLLINLDQFDVLCGMMNVDEKDHPNGRLAISNKLPPLDMPYDWLTQEQLPKANIFPVEFNGFCLMAIKRDIIKKYVFRADSVLRGGTDPAFGGSYDLVFCHWCKLNNINIYTNKRIFMKHLRQSGKLRVSSNTQIHLLKPNERLVDRWLTEQTHQLKF